MKMLYLFSLLLVNLFTGHRAQTIEGVIVGKDNRPVSKVYVFVVKGEEETITGSNGRFAVTTWQNFPVSLTVEHPGYKKLKLVIKEPGTKQLIRLEEK